MPGDTYRGQRRRGADRKEHSVTRTMQTLIIITLILLDILMLAVIVGGIIVITSFGDATTPADIFPTYGGTY